MSNAAEWALALGLVLAAVAASGGARAGETYPVWWAPELGLESLDERSCPRTWCRSCWSLC